MGWLKMFSWDFFSQPPSGPQVPAICASFPLPLYQRREVGWGRGCLTIHYVELHFNSHFQNGISSLPSLITVKLRPQVQISLFQFLEMVNVQGVSGEMWQHLIAPLTDFFSQLYLQVYSPSYHAHPPPLQRLSAVLYF